MQEQFKQLAGDSLSTFSEIATIAAKQLASKNASTESFATGNSLTNAQAFANLGGIGNTNRESVKALTTEPAIARLILENEDGERSVVYIARKTNLLLESGKQFASYASPIGRLAELPVGDEKVVTLRGKEILFSLVEKVSYFPSVIDGEWESTNNQYRHDEIGVFSIPSLRGLLKAKLADFSDELDRLLESEASTAEILAGISHQVRTAMGLRDQPILDQFQGEIFRLPINSQLIILGPPGTGKTTTLIKRLGQKLDSNNLDQSEQRFSELSGTSLTHENNWQMFTPSELLKHYLKEAFSKENVPASDARIKTWSTYRNDIARNVLGILKTPHGGKYTRKAEMTNLAESVIDDPRSWFEAFSMFHAKRLKQQLIEGADIVSDASSNDLGIVKELKTLAESLGSRKLVDVYRDLVAKEKSFKSSLDDSKGLADKLLKDERNLLFNRDKTVFDRLSVLLQDLQQDEELDEDAEFDEDENELSATPTLKDRTFAVNAYLAALKALARSRYRKRTLPKTSRAGKIVAWLGEKLPSEKTLLEIGRLISFQNGLRRFVNASKRYVTDVPSSYQYFRKSNNEDRVYYQEAPQSQFHLSDIELDVIILLMLRNCRELISQSFVERDIDTPRYETLRNFSSLFRTQIMVDEATDFSILQLACMEALSSHRSRSFFACGDFNQRITQTGIRKLDQIDWISKDIQVKNIKYIYRQSRALNQFASDLLKLQKGDLSTLGELPAESTHDGVSPVLIQNADVEQTVDWIADRIIEVERSVKQMPTVAVLVNSEADVKPIAERLSLRLESINLKAVACEEGKALGEGSDVRVFDIQHIKGLEFEAVFFVSVDKLAEQKPELFDRYLYVGATRAATYLGIACQGNLPQKLQPLVESFVEHWGG